MSNDIEKTTGRAPGRPHTPDAGATGSSAVSGSATSDVQMSAHTPPGAPGDYLFAVLGAALAVPVAMLAERVAGLTDLSMVFMLAVLIVAGRTRTGPAVLTAVLCFLAYNFFFIAPRYTFYIHATQGIATVLLFLAAALVAGRLAARLSMQVQALRAAHAHASTRRELAQQLAEAADETAVTDAATRMFRRHLDAEVWLRTEARDFDTTSVLRRTSQPDGAAQGGETVDEHGWWFLPIDVPGRPQGAIGCKRRDAAGEWRDADRALARAMTADIAQALLRIRLVGELQDTRMAHETERLRSALLSSVSHDLRTPLSSIIGAAGTLEHYGTGMDDADRTALLDTIRSEGERLDRHIRNLLDMTRLGHAGIALRRDWIGVDELVGAAIGRLHRHRPEVRVETTIEAIAGPIRVHPALVEQALLNLLDNAAKFSPRDGTIRVRAACVEAGIDGEAQVRIDVVDAGPGIPEADRERVFDMFYSAARGDRGRNGTGLGLAICRGMIEAHGGTVVALPGDGGVGACLRIVLPLDRHTDLHGDVHGDVHGDADA